MAQVSGGGYPKTNRDTPTFKPLPKHRVWWKSNLFAWFASTWNKESYWKYFASHR